MLATLPEYLKANWKVQLAKVTFVFLFPLVAVTDGCPFSYKTEVADCSKKCSACLFILL